MYKEVYNYWGKSTFTDADSTETRANSTAFNIQKNIEYRTVVIVG